MQFHAAAKRSNGVSSSSIPPSGGDGSTRSLDIEGVLLPLQPGRLLAIKQQAPRLQRLQQHGSPMPPKKNNQRSGETTATKALIKETTMKPEPINYLKLRRTDESAHALQRNRTQHVVAHEILSPSALALVLSSSKVHTAVDQAILEQQQALRHMDQVLEEMQDRVLGGGTPVTALKESQAVLASQLQQLQQQQVQVQKESDAASRRVQHLLTVVRNDISLLYKFTPLFKIYARHKTKSAWHRWTHFVTWHQEEQARIALLWPYAVTIQRVFRTKRDRWLRARTRLVLGWQQWEAARRMQRCIRKWLGRRERRCLAEAREAIKLQAAWRGRRDRRWVKKLLQDQLRQMLRSLTPTGNLHRLHEVTQRNPELVRPLNVMLSLIEETTIVVETDTTYKAKNARIAAKIASRPVEATRRQLFHAIFNLSEIIVKRARDVQNAKLDYNKKKEDKLRQILLEEDAGKSKLLIEAREKIAAEKENTKMIHEEMLTREYLRMMKTAEADRILRIKLNRSCREQAENAHMVIEEYQTRYLISEVRRRKLEDKKRLHEVEMRRQFLLDKEQEQTQLLLEMLKTDEVKRSEIRSKRLHAKAEENELWSKMSKEQQAEAIQRLQLKEKLEEEEHIQSEALSLAQQAHQREINRRREESRLRKQAELERELAAREAMDEEEKLSKRAHFKAKKALHAETWRAKREMEQVRYSLDPMHFSTIQALKEQEERERRARVLMKREDESMLQIRDKERKAKYFQACRVRRKQELAEATRAEKERALMHTEDLAADSIRATEKRASEQTIILHRMAALAQQEEMRREEHILEAKNRMLMHDEELRQRRVRLTVQIARDLKEEHERELMNEEASLARMVNARLVKKADKRFRERCIFSMMKEDVASMERQDLEAEGHRLEQLLWKPEDAVAFSHLVAEYPQFLATNVAIMQELCSLKEPPPYNFDYEAVQRHRRDETTLAPDEVPRKKRKPRKFFYHEFFEEDPVLSKLKPPPKPPSNARERWNRLAEHFLGGAWSCDSVRRAYLLMSEHKYGEATAAMQEAVRMAEASSFRQSSMSLLRQVARSYFKHWEHNFERSCLEKSLLYFQRASCSLDVLANPRLLQEISIVLEKAGRCREAAEVISAIIRCFPRYARLNEVIFRGGVVMISLQMYQQSREYLLHTLDANPLGWEQHEVLFLAARVMQFEGKPRRKLCSVAYEEAFRMNKKDAYYRIYPTWQEWIKNAATWRDIGDRYYAKQEFALARDAYQVMTKRIFKSQSLHGSSKRKQVLEARRISMNGHVDDTEKFEDGDWLQLARCAAILNDRHATVSALQRWFAQKSYRDRAIEQFHEWPLARWKLLGVEVPERVIEVVEDKKRAAKAMEETRLKAIQEKRQRVLKEKSINARGRLIAWADGTINDGAQPDSSPAKFSSSTSVHAATSQDLLALPERVGPWLRVVDKDANEVYYWNEETSEVDWNLRTE